MVELTRERRRRRGRWMGRSLLLEIDAAADAAQPLSEATGLSRRVEQAVLDAVPAARYVRCTPQLRG